MAKIKDRRKNLKNDTQDFFDDDFEVIYEDDLDDLLKNSFIEDDNEPDDYYYDDEFDDDDDYDIDDYDEDDYDNRRNNSKSSKRKDSNKSKKKHSLPNVVSPAAKAAKTGTRLIFKILNMILKAATLILIAVIICLLASTFGKNCSTYGNPLLITEEKNYILMAYLGTAGVLIFYEIITFFWVLMGRGKQGHNGQNQDTGRGLFSFLFIGITVIAAGMFWNLIPSSPSPLTGLAGGLQLYGSLKGILLPLCGIGLVSCIIRKIFS